MVWLVMTVKYKQRTTMGVSVGTPVPEGTLSIASFRVQCCLVGALV
jgi:hypothetical protein